jgi:hypothetical protein
MILLYEGMLKIINDKKKWYSVTKPERLERGRGWPLLTAETEVEGDSQRTYERGLSWLVRFACNTETRDICSALAALVVQNILSSVRYFNAFDTIAQQAVQAAVLGRLSLSVCLSTKPLKKTKKNKKQINTISSQ